MEREECVHIEWRGDFWCCGPSNLVPKVFNVTVTAQIPSREKEKPIFFLFFFLCLSQAKAAAAPNPV
ncbi:hypothetical protein QQP08_003899 [Theobroma cacao]|nr:hypothetical protein QQP08_003899 [Theobroma cacao]